MSPIHNMEFTCQHVEDGPGETKEVLNLRQHRHSVYDLVEEFVKHIKGIRSLGIIPIPAIEPSENNNRRIITQYYGKNTVPIARKSFQTLEEMAATQNMRGGPHFNLNAFSSTEYLHFLNDLFEIFNGIFFMASLPHTKIFQDLDGEFPLENVAIEGSFGKRIHDYKAKIIIYGPRDSWRHIGILLGAMIELYLKYFSCDCKGCKRNIKGYGITGKGHAWQQVAHILETSEAVHIVNGNCFGCPQGFRFHRQELYIEELSHWEDPQEKIIHSNVLRKWGWPDFDTSELIVEAAIEKRQERKK